VNGRYGREAAILPPTIEVPLSAHHRPSRLGSTITSLIGRAENCFVGRPDLDDTIARLRTYAAAGADCLHTLGIQTREKIVTVLAPVAPKPVNLLPGSDSELTSDDIARLGGRRVSVGGALARSA
jgi:2-methylisocitrate lyase-like PEP mutase family enzyme